MTMAAWMHMSNRLQNFKEPKKLNRFSQENELNLLLNGQILKQIGFTGEQLRVQLRHLVELLIELGSKRIATFRFAGGDEHSPGKKRDTRKAALLERCFRQLDRVGVASLQHPHFGESGGETCRRQRRPALCRCRQRLLENL